MPTYKLSYFNITGLGEPIRFLLSYCGIEFEDVRVDFDQWTAQLKNAMPMGQMPVLEIDGNTYYQSKAICRYIAKKNNLYGANDEEAIKIDAIVDSMDDLRLALTTFFWEQDPAFKEKLKEVAYKKLPIYLDKFEQLVRENKGFFVGGKITWADIHYTAYSQYLSKIVEGDFNKDHPKLKDLTAKITAHPNVKAYIDKRPNTHL